MKTGFSAAGVASVAATVAPEDIKCGDFVAVLNEIVEFPSFSWYDTTPNERDLLVRVRCIPPTSGTPLKVKAVCLPFIFVQSPLGQCETIDIRRIQLVRLNGAYAKQVRKIMRGQVTPTQGSDLS